MDLSNSESQSSPPNTPNSHSQFLFLCLLFDERHVFKSRGLPVQRQESLPKEGRVPLNARSDAHAASHLRSPRSQDDHVSDDHVSDDGTARGAVQGGSKEAQEGAAPLGNEEQLQPLAYLEHMAIDVSRPWACQHHDSASCLLGSAHTRHRDPGAEHGGVC